MDARVSVVFLSSVTLLLLLLLLSDPSEAEYRIQVRIDSVLGAIATLRLGNPSIELAFRVNFTSNECIAGVPMHERSITYNEQKENELFLVGSTFVRMPLRVDPYAASEEYDGLTGMGRRAGIWRTENRVSMTSTSFVVGGLHPSLTSLSSIPGPPVKCLTNPHDSEAICLTKARVLGKVYEVELFGDDPGIVVPSALYDELFQDKNVHSTAATLPELVLNFLADYASEEETEETTEKTPDERSSSSSSGSSGSGSSSSRRNRRRRGDAREERTRRRLARAQAGYCQLTYNQIGVPLPLGACKDPLHTKLSIKPSFYAGETDAHNTAKKRSHRTLHIVPRYDHPGRISLGSLLLRSHVFLFDFSTNSVVFSPRHTCLHVSDFHLVLVVLLALLLARWWVTDASLCACLGAGRSEPRFIVTVLSEITGIVVVIAAYATSHVFELIDADSFSFAGVTFAVASLIALELAVLGIQVLDLVAYVPYCFQLDTTRRVLHAQLLLYGMWLVLLDRFSESLATVPGVLLVALLLYHLLVNLLLMRKHTWARLPNTIWFVIITYYLALLLWTFCFAALKHFSPYFDDFFHQHTVFSPLFTLGTLMFLVLIASETSNYFIIKPI